MDHLKDAGIATGIHYPIPLHLQRAYVSLKYSLEDLPVATRLAGEIVSLPMFPQLATEQQERVAQEIRAFTSRATSKEVVADTLLTPAELTA
jgi:dTDP-4-amino-4,6-dideoxygalactose transaminase